MALTSIWVSIISFVGLNTLQSFRLRIEWLLAYSVLFTVGITSFIHASISDPWSYVESHYVEAGTAGSVQCNTCHKGKTLPAGTRHCKTCDRCSAQFDHHCKFLNVVRRG